jgi:hypothetical protein
MGKRKASEDVSADCGASSLKLKVSDKAHESMVVTFPSRYIPGSAKESVEAFEAAGSGGERDETTAVIVATDKRVDFVGTVSTEDSSSAYVWGEMSP